MLPISAVFEAANSVGGSGGGSFDCVVEAAPEPANTGGSGADAPFTADGDTGVGCEASLIPDEEITDGSTNAGGEASLTPGEETAVSVITSSTAGADSEADVGCDDSACPAAIGSGGGNFELELTAPAVGTGDGMEAPGSGGGMAEPGTNGIAEAGKGGGNLVRGGSALARGTETSAAGGSLRGGSEVPGVATNRPSADSERVDCDEGRGGTALLGGIPDRAAGTLDGARRFEDVETSFAPAAADAGGVEASFAPAAGDAAFGDTDSVAEVAGATGSALDAAAGPGSMSNAGREDCSADTNSDGADCCAKTDSVEGTDSLADAPSNGVADTVAGASSATKTAAACSTGSSAGGSGGSVRWLLDSGSAAAAGDSDSAAIGD